MSELISGKEAFDAAYNGDAAQWRWTGKDVEWRELKGETAFSINSLKDGVCEFRLKPRAITINGIEVPAPFEPKDGDVYFYLTNFYECGYDSRVYDSKVGMFYHTQAWRTRGEIMQVVAACEASLVKNDPPTVRPLHPN